MDAREFRITEAFVAQEVAHCDAALLAAEHTDVADCRAEKRAQDRQLVLVVVRDEDDGYSLRRRHSGDDLRWHSNANLVGVGKALTRRVSFAAVDDDRAHLELARE